MTFLRFVHAIRRMTLSDGQVPMWQAATERFIGGSGGGAASGVAVGAPVSPVDGNAWVEVSGVSPNRTVALKYRDGSTTVTVVEVSSED